MVIRLLRNDENMLDGRRCPLSLGTSGGRFSLGGDGGELAVICRGVRGDPIGADDSDCCFTKGLSGVETRRNMSRIVFVVWIYH